MKKQEVYDLFTDFLEKNSRFFISNIAVWKNNLILVEKYIEDNGCIPPTSKHEDKEIIKIGAWLNTQKWNYKNKTAIMQNKEIYDLFTDFLEKYKEYNTTLIEEWKKNLQLVKKYITEYSELPNKYNIDKNISRLGVWLSSQNMNHGKKERLMKNKEIYDLFTE